MEDADRTRFVPSHSGENILPADPIFTRLLNLASRRKAKISIRDDVAQIEKSHLELLNDVLSLRNTVRSLLDWTTLQRLEKGEEVWISILAPGSYDFAVAILATLALGAAASPISVLQPLAEAIYYVQKSRAVAVLTASCAVNLGQSLEAAIRRSNDTKFAYIPISSVLGQSRLKASDILLSSNPYLDLNAAGLLIFTSGTTGPPKGAVLRRAAISDGATSFADQLHITEADVLLHVLPVHHATGIWVSFFPFLLAGACIEFRTGSFDPQWTWDRWRLGGLSYFSGVPTIYMRMMRHYQQYLRKLPGSVSREYRKAPSQFKMCICGTSALPQPINLFWTCLLNGRRIIQRYGATEIGVVFNMPFDIAKDVPDGSVGEPSIGVDVKLSEGDEGEILVRSFNMFSKYLHNPEATKQAHDRDGYFRSGDLARREGNNYFILGRASVDIIKSGGYKISALDVERELLALPYVGEAMVVGVPDEEFGQRVGAVIALREDESSGDFLAARQRPLKDISLHDVRSDLKRRLAGYKMPTLLRILEGELPKSASGKVAKKTLGPTFFPVDYHQLPEVQKWTPEGLGSKL
jgi:malonyl-CoA/methylmalonyl-CoA synthetase